MKSLLIIALLSIALCCDIDTFIQCAKEQLGKPYKAQRSGPESFSCSGLVRFCFLRIGIDLPHLSSIQATYGTNVTDDYQPGDLLFFGWNSTIESIYHVAIYVGNNQYIESTKPVVTYTDMGRAISHARRIC